MLEGFQGLIKNYDLTIKCLVYIMGGLSALLVGGYLFWTGAAQLVLLWVFGKTGM